MRWFLCLLSLAIGCAPRIRGPADTSPIVRSVRFEGNGGMLSATSDFALRGALEQHTSPTGWWVAPRRRAVRLERDTLWLDGYRVETWYAHNGYFDAKFLGWEVVQKHARRNRTPVVEIVGHVSEGPESLVGEVSWVGGRSSLNTVLALIDRQRPLREGARFNLAANEETIELAVTRLQDQSYARATVESHIEAKPEEHEVDVTYTIEPGQAWRFGDVEVVTDGLRLPEDLIRDEITIEPCKGYQTSEIARTQRNLFGLGTFSVVNIVPQFPEARTDGACGKAPGAPVYMAPVRIELKESAFRQIRLGGGVQFENGKQDLHASVDFRHVNLLNRLWRLDLGTRAGYTWLLTFDELRTRVDPTTEGSVVAGAPVLDVTASLAIPRFPARKWRFQSDVGFELGVEEEYQFATPTFSTGLTWRLARAWALSFGYNIQYFDYFNLLVDLEALQRERPGIDISDPYTLSYVSQSLVYDSRGDPLWPRSGAFSTLSLAQAGPPGDYDYLRVEGDGRLYRPLGGLLDTLFGWRPRAIWAGRLTGGFIQPVGWISEERATVPYEERLYLGGSTSVRGWVDQHLGPYVYNFAEGEPFVSSETGVAICASARECLADITPVGGIVSLSGSTEIRGYWADTYGLAAFVDAGMVWASWRSIGRDTLPVPSVGIGARYRTPVGPLRLDVAMPIARPAMFLHEPRVQVYLSLSEAF